MDANRLRRAFTGFFVDRGHTLVPSAGLVPHHPTAPLFTNAGMNQFVPILLGEQPRPYPRATSVQKCIRTADIDIVGTTTRHLTFFEMLGNFSFGDYFKEGAITLAWELVTGVLGLDAERLWVTVHLDDPEAEGIWRDTVGVAPERIQRMGDDNWWEMQKGGTGPCGPCSEIYWDKGPEHGAAGGPAGGGPERYVEIWNLVFMQFNRMADGSFTELPTRNIDTGAGLERILPILQGTASVFETDVLRPVMAAAGELTQRRYGDDPRTDVSLRIMADHARAVTFLVHDGVAPSNDERGYVVRRLIRRMVRHAYQLGVERLVTPELVASVVDVMGEAHPDLQSGREAVIGIIGREEERFRQTLRSGSLLLEQELEAGRVTGDVAFRLHDTFGFPIEITEEIATERGVAVDREGFDRAMAEQRRRAKEARRAIGAEESEEMGRFRDLLERFGPTEFTGYQELESKAEVLAVVPSGNGRVEIFLDRTPFYAEGGGQVGDTGTVTTDTGRARVLDTTPALPGLHRHLAVIERGEVLPGQQATAAVDLSRREAVRRNHTGTHLLHWALREVLGAQVRQQSSYVGPDRLRFDINHHAPVAAEELEAVERLVVEHVLADEPVRAYETTMEHARELGALMFFGDKYGDLVRVVEAGSRSRELCGGTHVHALGMIGPLRVVSESSIGSNLRRVEAVTGVGTVELARHGDRLLQRVSGLLRTTPEEAPEAVERLLQRTRALEDELRELERRMARGEARQLAASGSEGIVVARRDGLRVDQLRELATATRSQPGVRGVVLIGSPDGQRVALAAAVDPDEVGATAPELISEPARLVGGGGGGKQAEVAQAGGRDATRIDDALARVRARLGLAS